MWLRSLDSFTVKGRGRLAGRLSEESPTVAADLRAARRSLWNQKYDSHSESGREPGETARRSAPPKVHPTKGKQLT